MGAGAEDGIPKCFTSHTSAATLRFASCHQLSMAEPSKLFVRLGQKSKAKAKYHTIALQGQRWLKYWLLKGALSSSRGDERE